MYGKYVGVVQGAGSACLVLVTILWVITGLEVWLALYSLSPVVVERLFVTLPKGEDSVGVPCLVCSKIRFWNFLCKSVIRLACITRGQCVEREGMKKWKWRDGRKRKWVIFKTQVPGYGNRNKTPLNFNQRYTLRNKD